MIHALNAVLTISRKGHMRASLLFWDHVSNQIIKLKNFVNKVMLFILVDQTLLRLRFLFLQNLIRKKLSEKNSHENDFTSN